MKVFRSVVLASLLMLGAGAVHAQTKPQSQMLDGIAAVVNDEVVLRSDVEEQLYLFLLRNQMPTDSTVVDTLREQILDQMIEEKLIVAEAKRQGVTVPDAEVNKEVDEAIRSAKERLGADYVEQLRRENMTEEKLREKYRSEVRRQMLAQRLVQKQFVRKSPTQTEAEVYFNANKDKFPRVPPEVRVLVIQIPVEPDSAVSAQAKARVAAARKRILAGEKFAKVAGEVSEDQSSARSGGDLGFVGRGAMDPAFEKAVFEMKTGQVSEPLRTGYGWHLLEVIERDTVKTRAGRDSLDREGRPALEAHVRHILIRVPLTEADIERSRKVAVRIREQATKGTDFVTLVKRHSKYQGAKSEDGDLGFLSLGTLQPAIRAGLDSLAIGKISEPLMNPAGFNIFKVTDRKPERQYTLEEIKDELPEVVAQMQFRDRYQEWVKGLRAKAHIEIRKS
ncbi:MAG TPA: peptidylprolyl isomerase [Candidatus Limnocylindria bacterium]|nr:peptidylprolyl isomerase [Candidatus Limnocylindria bacterium]